MIARSYVCNKCASASGLMPRQAPRIQFQESKHTKSSPEKPTNGVFYCSDTNAWRAWIDDAGVTGTLEIEAGDRNSTNVIYFAEQAIGFIERKGQRVGETDALRWAQSSNSVHIYPVDLSNVVCSKCGSTIP